MSHSSFEEMCLDMAAQEALINGPGTYKVTYDAESDSINMDFMPNERIYQIAERRYE